MSDPATSAKAAERLLSGAAWEDFCDTLKVAGRMIERFGDEPSDLDRAEWYRFLTRLTRSGLERLVENGEERLITAVERGEISTQKPPIFVDGRQVDSLDHMRQWLRLRADPTRYPDMDKPVIDPSTGLRPSKKPVLIRCDQAQVFGWVQAIMQYCTFVPGNKQSDELQKSPMIYKLEIAVGTNKKPGEE